MTQPKVHIVEDDSQISKSLTVGLSVDGFSVTSSENLTHAREQISQNKPDILLLDINLPDGNGLDFCKELRAQGSQTPIIFLSARTDEETVVEGMNIGADDYLRKPFGLEELKARMRRALKGSQNSSEQNIIQVGDLKMNALKRVAHYGSHLMTLSPREFEILLILSKTPGDAVSREKIIESFGDKSTFDDRTVDSHISHLRKKLRDVAIESMQIIPVYGVGYRLHWIK